MDTIDLAGHDPVGTSWALPADPFELQWQLVYMRAAESGEASFPAPLQQGSRLWHYTNAAGLQGIVESKRLWATSILCLNDPSEGQYGSHLLRQCWSKWQDAHDAAQEPETARMIERLLEVAPYGRGFQTSAWHDVHVLSLSLNGDALPLWQYHPAGTAYAIEFTKEELQSLHLSAAADKGTRRSGENYPRLFWQPVLYQLETQRVLAEELLDFLWATAPRADSWTNLSSSSGLVIPEAVAKEFRINVWIDIYSLYARLFAATVKHNGYSHEQEVRLIVDDVEASERSYRASKQQLVAYTSLKGSGDAPLPIQRIRCGPSTPAAAERIVGSLLCGAGLSGARVDRSAIPYR